MQHFTRLSFLPWTINSEAMDHFIKCGPDDPSAVGWRDSQLTELGIVNVTVSTTTFHLPRNVSRVLLIQIGCAHSCRRKQRIQLAYAS